MSLVINRSDLKRDTFHCSGHGGQNVNKVETGVRWTHIPTGLSAQSCQERTQGKNQTIALRLLISKLIRLETEKKGQGRRQRYEGKPDASFGSQVRSYYLCGHQRVIDHRTRFEHPNPRSVLDGELDEFIRTRTRRSFEVASN